MEPLKTIHLLLEGEAQVDGERLRFFQGIVLYARDVQDAHERAAAVLLRREATLLSIDAEETREVDPNSVAYEQSFLDEGVLGLSGRIWVKPKLSTGGLLSKLKKFVRRSNN
jgi:hypothetical protein